MKEVIPIVRVSNGDVFLKGAGPNALDRPLLGLGHDIPNISGIPLGNGCGFTVLPDSKVCLSRNVSLQRKDIVSKNNGNGNRVKGWKTGTEGMH